MKITLDLNSHDIDQLRTVMDHLPLNPYSPLIRKVLTALPMTAGDLPGTAPASESLKSAGCGSSEVNALIAFQKESQERMDRLDKAIAQAGREFRGNPRYDKEWSV